MQNSPDRVPDQRAAVVRESFNGTESQLGTEVSTTAQAEQARAIVESQYVMALRRPRNMLNVRSKLLKECERPRFADAVEYKLPRKKWNPEKRQYDQIEIRGLSIRFAEAAFPALGNLLIKSAILMDDADKRIGEVMVIDLETNACIAEPWIVQKTIERKTTKEWDIVRTQRTNSAGETIYVIEAPEGDIETKMRAAMQKAKRNAINAMVPGDIREEVVEKSRETIERGIKEDPNAYMKKLVDAFSTLNVRPDQLEEWLGHAVSDVTPDEILELRDLFAALREGETTWAEILENGRKAEAKPLTDEEKTERKTLQVKAAKTKTERPEIHAAALKKIGLPASTNPTTMSLVLLRRFVEQIDALAAPAAKEEPAPKAEASETEDGEAAERLALMSKIQKARKKDEAGYDAACRDLGVDPDAALGGLTLDMLDAISEALSARKGA